MENNQIRLLQHQSISALSQKQKDKLEDLKQRFEKSSLPSHIDEDYLLTKFLKAQNLNVSAAENMLRTHLQWRKQWNFDSLYQDHKPLEIFQKYYPHTMIGHDNDGTPLWIFRHGGLDMKGLLHSCRPEDFKRHIIYLLACDAHEAVLQSEKLGRLIDTHVLIVDLDGFDMRKSLWRPGLELIIQLMKLFDANFPQVMKKGIIINAPKVFTIFWSLISPFFGQATRDQIQIYGRDGWKEVLVKLTNPDVLPLHWGGNAVDDVDGNPYCSSKICMGGEIPVSNYCSNIFLEHEDFKTVTIPKHEVFRVKLHVNQPNSSIVWTFETESHDIGFGIKFQNNAPNGESKYIKEVKRISFELVPESGIWRCDELGKYTLVFDNRFSWLISKTLMYNVQVVTADTTAS